MTLTRWTGLSMVLQSVKRLLGCHLHPGRDTWTHGTQGTASHYGQYPSLLYQLGKNTIHPLNNNFNSDHINIGAKGRLLFFLLHLQISRGGWSLPGIFIFTGSAPRPFKSIKGPIQSISHNVCLYLYCPLRLTNNPFGRLYHFFFAFWHYFVFWGSLLVNQYA